jgi:hypothetical protein
VRQDDRAPFERALRHARAAAYGAGEFVEQESFMTAGEILDLAARAGVARPGSRCSTCAAVSPDPGAS